MKTLNAFTIALAVTAFPAVLSAEDVSLSHTHLCCGQCVKAVAGTLKKVKGVSDAKCDRAGKTVTFKATNKKTAQAGLNALVRAGFYGTAKVDGKAAKLPARKIKAGTKAAKANFVGAHLCCGACAKAVEKAAKSVSGVSEVTVDRKKRTISVSGTDVDVAAVIAALNKAGFSSRYAAPKKK
jgi:copper chaperone CopZ